MGVSRRLDRVIQMSSISNRYDGVSFMLFGGLGGGVSREVRRI